MRKAILILLLLTAVVFLASPAFAQNMWQNTQSTDEFGADADEWAFSVVGSDMFNTFPGMDGTVGYSEDGKIWKTLAVGSTLGSRLFFETNQPLSAPLYSLPCPYENLRYNNNTPTEPATASHYDCSYVAGDPQTDDVPYGAGEMDENEGIVLDDLYTWVEDHSEEATNTQRHLEQGLDILFYVRSSVWGNPGGSTVAPDGEDYPLGLGISQTLDQDLADFEGTVGGNGNGMAGVIWQDFNLRKDGEDHEKETGDDLWDNEGGWLDQLIYAYVGDIESGSGNSGIKQSYLSKKIVIGKGGGCMLQPGCTITETQSHPDLTVNSNKNVQNNLNKDITHKTNTSLTDP
ncbi:MAG: hypothetical protein HZA12_05065 [Nitrospirae bacterium]|nr:hypothetical protein [Nitrospirota bacterium]